MEQKEHNAKEIALACLQAICADGEARDADRIAAAKLLLEHQDGETASTLTIVMEGIPEDYLN